MPWPKGRLLHTMSTVIHDLPFKESVEAYKDALKGLKALGYGHIESYKETKPSGRPQKFF